MTSIVAVRIAGLLINVSGMEHALISADAPWFGVCLAGALWLGASLVVSMRMEAA